MEGVVRESNTEKKHSLSFLKYYSLVYLINMHFERDWGPALKMWNTAKAILPKPLTIVLMTGNNIFNYVRSKRNRLNYSGKNFKYVLEKARSLVWILKTIYSFFFPLVFHKQAVIYPDYQQESYSLILNIKEKPKAAKFLLIHSDS